MTIQYAKALIGLCIDEGLKQGVLKNRGEFEELLDYLDKYFIDTGKMTSGSSEIQKDLEEAAEHYASVTDPEAHGIDFIREVFIAGEECQYQKDRAEFAKLKAKEWSDGYNEGIAKGKEQMMKEAIEAIISQCPGSNEIIFHNPITIHSWEFPWKFSAKGLNKGDKVKLIIVKED